MKRLLLIIALAAVTAVNAQEQYTQKLDSVIGADNFDWIRWKKVFDYYSEDGGIVITRETHYEWENQTWVPKQKTETGRDAANRPQFQQTFVFQTNDTVAAGWEPSRYTTYEYDNLNRLELVMNYVGMNNAGEWVENSKYDYIYNTEGLLDTCLYSTIRNGEWRASERIGYSYNEAQQCIGLLAQRKGGWGPFGNSWMDSYRYEFEYEEGNLVAELRYAGGGWFGGDLALDTKIDYVFDANGNLETKTASVTNEGKDWIVRDVYVNKYNLAIDASTIQGLESFWQSIAAKGMGFAHGGTTPVNNKWLSCTIASEQLDTEFTLYYSDDYGVDEIQNDVMQVYGQQGCLRVENEAASDITVFDLLGRKVASRQQVLQCEFQLKPGLYIVGNGKQFVKTVVH